MNWPQDFRAGSNGDGTEKSTHIEDSPTWSNMGTRRISELPQKFYFVRERQSADESGDAAQESTAWDQIHALGGLGATDPEDVADELLTTLEENPQIDHIYCEVFDRAFQKGRTRDQVFETAKRVRDELAKLIANPNKAARRISPIAPSVQYIDQLTATLTLTARADVTVNVTILDAEPEGITCNGLDRAAVSRARAMVAG